MFTLPFTTLGLFADFFKASPSYGTLEEYIVSKNPQTADDIDRLTREYLDGTTNRNNWTY